MKELIVLRHATAESTAETRSRDFDRPLSEQGRADALRQADWLREFHLIPDRVVSSPALRALQTAELVTERLGFDRRRITRVPAVYEASVGDLVRIIEEHPGERVMLVGHNPGLGGLAGFASGAYVRLNPGSAAWIEFDEPAAGPLQPGSGRLRSTHHVRD